MPVRIQALPPRWIRSQIRSRAPSSSSSRPCLSSGIPLGGRGNYDVTPTDFPGEPKTAWSAASDGTLEERIYYCRNWRHDVVALIDDSANQVEQVRYTAYGIPDGLPAGDLDSDGDVDNADVSAFDALIAYDVRADLDLDGDNDSTDRTIINGNRGNSLGFGVLSLVGNRKAYAGYEFDDALQAAYRLYHVRHRVLNSDLGRWIRRDPAGYVDGINLYGYVRGNPTPGPRSITVSVVEELMMQEARRQESDRKAEEAVGGPTAVVPPCIEFIGPCDWDDEECEELETKPDEGLCTAGDHGTIKCKETAGGACSWTCLCRNRCLEHGVRGFKAIVLSVAAGIFGGCACGTSMDEVDTESAPVVHETDLRTHPLVPDQA